MAHRQFRAEFIQGLNHPQLHRYEGTGLRDGFKTLHIWVRLWLPHADQASPNPVLANGSEIARYSGALKIICRGLASLGRAGLASALSYFAGFKRSPNIPERLAVVVGNIRRPFKSSAYV